jgi:hypothetical protein
MWGVINKRAAPSNQIKPNMILGPDDIMTGFDLVLTALWNDRWPTFGSMVDRKGRAQVNSVDADDERALVNFTSDRPQKKRKLLELLFKLSEDLNHVAFNALAEKNRAAHESREPRDLSALVTMWEGRFFMDFMPLDMQPSLERMVAEDLQTHRREMIDLSWLAEHACYDQFTAWLYRNVPVAAIAQP